MAAAIDDIELQFSLFLECCVRSRGPRALLSGRAWRRRHGRIVRWGPGERLAAGGTGRRVWSCSAGWRVKWSPRSPLAGKFAAQLLSTGEEFLSVSPWRYDRRESEAERRRLREGVAEDEWRALLGEVN